MAMINLRGKIALVTGGSRGIGAATALLLAQAGANVAITYHSNKKAAGRIEAEITNLGRRCLVVRCNVAAERDVRAAIRTVKKTFGRIDILVNNAGIWKRGPVNSMTSRQWDETLDINLRSVFLFCREVTPLMKRKGGKIINIASTAGQRGEAFHSHYAASKGGILAFTKSAAVELAPYGIQVNCVAPGWVDTDMSARVLRSPRLRKTIDSSIPRGRVATARDIAGPILFLASDLSDHMTGSTLSVNGGGVMSM